ncbi:MAG: proprotein convertase P-domain-containing protein, partial [Flavobacterium sp.]
MNNGSNGTITTCSGTFVDNGGNVADYGNNQNSTITFCPSTPGEIIKVVFTSFSTEAFAGTCTDYLDVWYGNTVGAPGTNNDRLCGNVGNTTFVSTSPDGCISFQFISNGNVNQAGWSATISCVTPCTNPIAALTDSSPVNICPSTATNPGPLAVSFNASASTASGGFSVSSYEWAWGDGTSSITTTPTTTHTYSGPGIYSVSLIVRNNNTDIYPLGCQSTNPATRVVRVYPPPNFTGSSPTTVNVNCGESLNLNGLVSSQTISSIPLAVSQSTITLADAAGVNYDSTIDISGFFPSGSIVTPSCYPTITFDLEHTHSGDLEITLISPTGQSVMIYDQHGGTNDFGICANPLDNGVAGCPATYTVVNSGGVNWTAAGVTTTAPANGACTYTGACEVGSNYISQTYNSTNPFTALNGAGLNGIWTLRVRDNLSADDGTISGWSLTFPTSCYTNSEFVTPDIATLTWSTTGVGPAVPSQTTTSVAVIDPGPGGCPTPGTCIGNKLTNNVTIGPFLNSGTFSYALTAVDEYGCNYVRNVAVNVATCPCLLNLTSLSNTNNQSVCLGSAIVPITYNYGGVSTGATVTGLPPGLNLNISGGLITISGTPTAIGTFNFTVNSTGCSPNISLTGKIIVQTAPSLTSITNNTPICLNSTATFNLVGTPNAIVSYNINGSSSQNVTLNPSGIATISIPSVGSNTNFNAISITNSGTIITGNGSSASGGPNAIRATGPISNLGAAAGNPNCALVNSLNPNLTITLPQIVPIGTTITISLARDNTSGEVTVASGGASSIFNSGINDFLERIIITTITQTNVVTITSRAGAVWVDGVEFAFTLPGCTSLITNTSTVNISTPAVPIIATTAPTCLSDSTSSISNYIATNTYAFTPSGPTVGATGAITGMVIGTSYTVTASNASCISASSASFITAVQLTAPSVPIITTTAATCLASGTTTINNYTSGINYVFIPTGPIVTGTGTILGLTNGTSYTVTASNGSCSSVVSAAFSNTEQLATPTVPTIAYVAPTCLTDGSSSVSNYSATNTYAFSPSGPTVGAAGEIIGMVLGTSYTVTANNGICVSTASAPFSNASQLITPVAP